MELIKIGFVLLSNSKNPIPSTRIAVLNMFSFLKAANFDPHIVFEPSQGDETPNVDDIFSRLLSENFQIIYFQKVHGSSVEKLAVKLSAAGIRTVYGVCDLMNLTMTSATDATIVVTDYLKSLYPSALQEKVSVVHDGIEYPEKCKTDISQGAGSRNKILNAVLVTSVDLDRLPVLGSIPDWLKVTIVGRYPSRRRVIQRLREARWKYAEKQSLNERIAYLKFLSNRRIRCLAWDSAGVYDAMQKADVGIIPIDALPQHLEGQAPPMWKVKSENRLTMKMCVGLPVVATPIPSYEPIITHGENGFFARTRDEWFEYLTLLRDSELRFKIGERARKSVLTKYSMEEQARCLISVLRGLV